jgi:hypothetical protein
MVNNHKYIQIFQGVNGPYNGIYKKKKYIYRDGVRGHGVVNGACYM